MDRRRYMNNKAATNVKVSGTFYYLTLNNNYSGPWSPKPAAAHPVTVPISVRELHTQTIASNMKIEVTNPSSKIYLKIGILMRFNNSIRKVIKFIKLDRSYNFTCANKQEDYDGNDVSILYGFNDTNPITNLIEEYSSYNYLTNISGWLVGFRLDNIAGNISPSLNYVPYEVFGLVYPTDITTPKLTNTFTTAPVSHSPIIKYKIYSNTAGVSVENSNSLKDYGDTINTTITITRSTNAGKSFILRILEQRFNGTLLNDSIYSSWLNTPTLNKIKLTRINNSNNIEVTYLSDTPNLEAEFLFKPSEVTNLDWTETFLGSNRISTKRRIIFKFV